MQPSHRPRAAPHATARRSARRCSLSPCLPPSLPPLPPTGPHTPFTLYSAPIPPQSRRRAALTPLHAALAAPSRLCTSSRRPRATHQQASSAAGRALVGMELLAGRPRGLAGMGWRAGWGLVGPGGLGRRARWGRVGWADGAWWGAGWAGWGWGGGGAGRLVWEERLMTSMICLFTLCYLCR